MVGAAFTSDRLSAYVTAKVANCKELMEQVYRESVRRTVQAAQTPVGLGGNMPVRTGFLRASGHAAIGTLTGGLMDNPNPHGFFPYDEAAVNLVIDGAKLNDTITFAYAAKYAQYVEFGVNGRPGRRFIGLAAQRWPQIVSQVSREVEAQTL